MNLPNRLLTTRQAAEFLGLSESALEKYRVVGGGPRYLKLGHKIVRYAPQELKNWSMARVYMSTSDAGTTIKGLAFEGKERPPELRN